MASDQNQQREKVGVVLPRWVAAAFLGALVTLASSTGNYIFGLNDELHAVRAAAELNAVELARLRLDFQDSRATHRRDTERFQVFMDDGERWTKEQGLETRRQLEKFSEYVRDYIENHSEWGRGIVGEWGANIKHLQECCRQFSRNHTNR